MRDRYKSASFYLFILVANFMTIGMFANMNMPISYVSYVDIGSNVQAKAKPIVATPSRIVIADVGIDLVVDKGSFDPNTDGWTLADDRAFYADASLPLNDSNGTTLLYGHAQSAVFGRLTDLQPGMDVKVYGSDQKVFTYKYVSKNDVLPTDISVFTEYGAPKLVLQTCTGPFDAYRALYSFEFVSVEETK